MSHLLCESLSLGQMLRAASQRFDDVLDFSNKALQLVFADIGIKEHNLAAHFTANVPVQVIEIELQQEQDPVKKREDRNMAVSARTSVGTSPQARSTRSTIHP